MLKRPSKKSSMVKKKAPQPAQKKKRNVQSLTLAEPSVPSVLSLLENSDISEFSDSESDLTVDERTVSTCADKTNSSKSNPFDIDSLDLDLELWRLNKTTSGKRPLTEVALSKDVEFTYKTSLKGPAPGPSANAMEHKFVKRKNIVKRFTSTLSNLKRRRC
jgi:hypothetical protein